MVANKLVIGAAVGDVRPIQLHSKVIGGRRNGEEETIVLYSP